jgi:hypothetical protein
MVIVSVAGHHAQCGGRRHLDGQRAIESDRLVDRRALLFEPGCQMRGSAPCAVPPEASTRCKARDHRRLPPAPVCKACHPIAAPTRRHSYQGRSAPPPVIFPSPPDGRDARCEPP